MIEYTRGDLLLADADALVNAVNCVGVMGRGIALQFKRQWPDNFRDYAAACKRQQVQPGKMFVHSTGAAAPAFIINFPTKRHWKQRSLLADIEAGLADLRQVISANGIQSVALPPLGSGLGGLDWGLVKPRIESALADLRGLRVLIYEPDGIPVSAQAPARHAPPAMTPGRAALIELIAQYLKGLLDPTVSSLEVHKLMYFMQAAGEPLELQFKAGHYGPYAENLRHVMNAIEGHFVTGYADGGDAPGKVISLMPGAQAQATRFLESFAATRQRFSQVADLVQGFESPFGLELLATVHWCGKHNPGDTVEQLTEQVYAWHELKPRFSPRQIRLAAATLADKGWLKLAQCQNGA
ncbi:macro domain-containing protein [Silvimonas sp. JCM 19000]